MDLKEAKDLVMDTPRYDPLRLRLISIFILLIGLSINGCDVELPVAAILDGYPDIPNRSDAEILADGILQRETDDFFFDLPKRNQLVDEIERVLSLIRAAYPFMNAINAEEAATPGQLVIYLEPDFYEILKEMIEDKQGLFRFETGNAEFDALNAKLKVQAVQLGDPFLKGLLLYFDTHVNLRVASEAYSMVEGIRRVSDGFSFNISADIEAFRHGETWSVIFWHGWGDCPSGCLYEESFSFTVRGAQVQMLSLGNRTPLGNAPAHRWSWGGGWFSAGDSPDLDGFAGGCSLFGEIEAFPNQLSVSCGYRAESLPRENRFLDNLDHYEFTGVVLLLIATQERMVIGNSEAHSTVVASETLRVAKTAAEIQNPENVYFENVLMPINPPPLSSPFERWWGAVYATFIVCWDHPQTGRRALPGSNAKYHARKHI